MPQLALLGFHGTPLKEIAGANIRDIEQHKAKKWMMGVTITREDLADWSRREMADPRSQERRRKAAEMNAALSLHS